MNEFDMLLLDTLKRSEETSILIPNSYSLSYNGLRDRITELKDLLIQTTSLQNQDTIVIILPNSLDFVVTFFSVTYLGCIAAPINSKFTLNELKFYLSDFKPKLLITNTQILQSNEGIKIACAKLDIQIISVDISATSCALDGMKGVKSELRIVTKDDIALLLHTSGTTGRPKGTSTLI